MEICDAWLLNNNFQNRKYICKKTQKSSKGHTIQKVNKKKKKFVCNFNCQALQSAGFTQNGNIRLFFYCEAVFHVASS